VRSGRDQSVHAAPGAYLFNADVLSRQRTLNRLHSTVILSSIMALSAGVGFVLAGIDGIILGALLTGAALLVGSTSGTVLFRQARAISLDVRNAPGIALLVNELARRAGLDRPPSIHLLPSPSLQAMSAGDRAEPAIAITSGLLQSLPPRELAAVLAHEIAHIRHGDAFVMRLAAAAGALTQTMSTIGIFLLIAFLPVFWATGEVLMSPVAAVLLVVSPMVSDLLQLSLSRRREFLADAGAVELTGDPQGLAVALRLLETLRGSDWERFRSRGGRWLHWLRTHPSTEERIKRLYALVAPARPDLPLAPQPVDLQSLFGPRYDPWRRRFMRPLR
jgi:heat shock protein HtpX